MLGPPRRELGVSRHEQALGGEGVEDLLVAAAGGPAGRRYLGLDVQEHRQIWRWGEAVDLLHPWEGILQGLIGEGGQDVAVADDHAAVLQGGLDLPAQVVEAVRGEEQRQGRRIGRLGELPEELADEEPHWTLGGLGGQVRWVPERQEAG